MSLGHEHAPGNFVKKFAFLAVLVGKVAAGHVQAVPAWAHGEGPGWREGRLQAGIGPAVPLFCFCDSALVLLFPARINSVLVLVVFVNLRPSFM